MCGFDMAFSFSGSCVYTRIECGLGKVRKYVRNNWWASMRHNRSDEDEFHYNAGTHQWQLLMRGVPSSIDVDSDEGR